VSKGPEAFRTISEVAEELNLPQHVLRFWETRFNQIRPMKRGGGRRYYRPDDVELLRGIRHLLYGEGYTIRGVQRILKEQGPRFAIAAGRGEAVALMPPMAEDDEPETAEEIAAGPAAPPANGGEGEYPDPAFDPREFRAREAPANGAALHLGTVARLSEDEVSRWQSTLTELLDLKRLLDQSR
jgi:DNA-binding transcriptional MerR regulator